MANYTVGSLFAGIGGFDLAFGKAGFRTAWYCEVNAQASAVLAQNWPDAPNLGDVRYVFDHDGFTPVDVVCGGDPCPKHSRARSNRASRHPDLAGYFLAVVGRLRPRWVVRENVPAPTVSHFDAALDALGYGTTVIRMDAATFTGQSRPRDFVVGCYQATRQSLRDLFSDFRDGAGPCQTQLGTREVAPALTTHRTRYDSRDCYVWEPANGLRILDGDEREALAGFPEGWTAGLSEGARARMYGNAVVPQVVYPLAVAIREWLEAEDAAGSTDVLGYSAKSPV